MCHYYITAKLEKISWAPWPVLVILWLGSKVHKALTKLLLLRGVWKVKPALSQHFLTPCAIISWVLISSKYWTFPSKYIFKWLPVDLLCHSRPCCTNWESKYELGNPYWRGRLGTADLLIKIGLLVKKYSFSMKSSRSELVSRRRSTVMILSLQLGFPDVLLKHFIHYIILCGQKLGCFFK